MTSIADFLRWGANHRSWRLSTQRNYGERVGHYLDRLRRAGADPADAEYSHVEAFYVSQPATEASRNGTRKALVAYHTFLVAQRVRKDNPALELPTVRPRKIPPRALTAEQGAAVWEAAATHSPLMHAGVALFLSGGLRCSEARFLRWSSVLDGWLRVDGKGGQQRNVPLHPAAMRIVEHWRERCPCPQWVLPSPRRTGHPVSDSWIRNRIAEIGAAAGVPGLVPHDLRHTMATETLEQSSGDVRGVQDLLGHASVQTTQRYTHVRDRRLVELVGQQRFFDDEPLADVVDIRSRARNDEPPPSTEEVDELLAEFERLKSQLRADPQGAAAFEARMRAMLARSAATDGSPKGRDWVDAP